MGHLNGVLAQEGGNLNNNGHFTCKIELTKRSTFTSAYQPSKRPYGSHIS